MTREVVDERVPELAVVLIARNQAWNVARLVGSVLASPTAAAAEIVLADSASQDDTALIATELGVRVVPVGPSRRLTAAAGRVAGQVATSSEYILFLDGDMELVNGWLEPALALLRGSPDVAGIAGTVRDLPKDTSRYHAERESASEKHHRVRETPFIGGASLYRRSALEAVGSFDSALYSDEEPEVGLRLRAAGFRLLLDDRPMVVHYSDPPDKLATTYGRWRRNLYLGAGQIVRKHLGTPLLAVWLRERGFWIPPALALLALVIALAVWRAGGGGALALTWTTAMLLAFGGLAWRRRSLSSAAETFLERAFHLDGLLRGLWLYRPTTSDAGATASRHRSAW